MIMENEKEISEILEDFKKELDFLPDDDYIKSAYIDVFVNLLVF